MQMSVASRRKPSQQWHVLFCSQMAIDAVRNPLLLVAVQVQAALHTSQAGGLPGTAGIALHKYHIKMAMTQAVLMRDATISDAHHRMRNEDFGLVSIILLLHFLSRDRLEADLHHGSVSLSQSVCLSVCLSALFVCGNLTTAGHLPQTKALTASTDSPRLSAELLLALFLSLYTGSVRFSFFFFF